MAGSLDALTAAVANDTTVEASAITLLQGLSAKLVQAKNDPVAVQALADQINANAQGLSDAITANTPTDS